MKPYVGELIQFIKSDGTVFDLNSPPSRAVMNMTGWGKPPDERHTISGPYQHGDTFVSYRLRPRTISMEVVYPYLSRSDWHQGRSNLVQQMGLNNASPNAPETGQLRWEYFEGSTHKIRCLDACLSRGLGFTPLDGWRQWSVSEGLEFIAYNPVIYDPTLHTTNITTWTSTLRFPMVPPFVLGASVGTAAITYNGTWEEHPEIVIVGPAANIYIENQSTNKFIRLLYGVSLGETVTFDLTYNDISVINDAGVSLLNYVSDDSSLAEFAFHPDPILAGGVNNIVVYLAGDGATTKVTFNYYDRYYGV